MKEFEMLPIKSKVVENQEFEIGRTIQPFNCTCKECDFLHCPKNNYCVRTEPDIYSVKEFFNFYRDYLLKLTVKTTVKGYCTIEFDYNSISEFFNNCIKFPKGVFWSIGSMGNEKTLDGKDIPFEERIVYNIDLFNRQEKWLGTIWIRSNRDGLYYNKSFRPSDIENYHLSNRALNQLTKEIKKIDELKRMCEIENAKSLLTEGTFRTGWLSPSCEFIPCKIYQHALCAFANGGTEAEWENSNYIKIFGSGLDEWYGISNKEQSEWLIENGYVSKDNHKVLLHNL